MASRPKLLHLSKIDVLRGLAALAVCCFHFSDDNYLSTNLFQSAFRYSNYGVDVFFVISGFVIPLALHRSGYGFENIGEFLLKRWRRLYPAFVAALFLRWDFGFLQDSRLDFKELGSKLISSNFFLISS
jgi:peptidoglycan/LPS O-acetylase OafA/YrhL